MMARPKSVALKRVWSLKVLHRNMCRLYIGTSVDYHEVFSPLIRAITLLTVMAIAAVSDLEVHQMDVKTAFLNGDLEEKYIIVLFDQNDLIQKEKTKISCKFVITV